MPDEVKACVQDNNDLQNNFVQLHDVIRQWNSTLMSEQDAFSQDKQSRFFCYALYLVIIYLN